MQKSPPKSCQKTTATHHQKLNSQPPIDTKKRSERSSVSRVYSHGENSAPADVASAAPPADEIKISQRLADAMKIVGISTKRSRRDRREYLYYLCYLSKSKRANIKAAAALGMPCPIDFEASGKILIGRADDPATEEKIYQLAKLIKAGELNQLVADQDKIIDLLPKNATLLKFLCAFHLNDYNSRPGRDESNFAGFRKVVEMLAEYLCDQWNTLPVPVQPLFMRDRLDNVDQQLGTQSVISPRNKKTAPFPKGEDAVLIFKG